MESLLKAEIKKSRKKEIYFLIFLIFLFFILNYKFFDRLVISFFSSEEALITEKVCFVERVIDGDTIVACQNTTRLLGINTPEKGERFYKEAKEYLSKRIENKSVTLRFSNEKYDKYGRVLAYVYLGEECINSKIIENGFANPYFLQEKDFHFKEFFESWEICLKKNRGICTISKDSCSKCISLEKLDPIKEKVVIKNNCDFSCNLNKWSIKDEGRKIFFFSEYSLYPNSEVSILVSNEKISSKKELIWKREDTVWTDSGDTLFLRDSMGELVLWKNYS